MDYQIRCDVPEDVYNRFIDLYETYGFKQKGISSVLRELKNFMFIDAIETFIQDEQHRDKFIKFITEVKNERGY